MTLRLFTLQAHYRKPLDFTAEALEAAATGWKGLNAALGLATSSDERADLSADLATARARFVGAMDDDLNTAAALAVLFELAKPLRALANRLERGDASAAAEAASPPLAAQGQLLRELAGVLGLEPEAGDAAQAAAEGPSADEIQAQIEARLAAKAARNFAEADRIRDTLKAQGIELIDRPGGITEWLRS